MTHPKIELAREPTLGNPQSVEHSAEDVQEPHQHQPAERCTTDVVEPTLHVYVVNRGNDARQSEGHEHSGTNRPKLRCRELVPERGDDREESQDDDDRQVDDFRLIVAIETVVKPRNERAHDEHRNSAVVESKIIL